MRQLIRYPSCWSVRPEYKKHFAIFYKYVYSISHASVVCGHHDEDVGLAASEVCKRHSRLLPTRQVLDEDGVSVTRKTEASQHLATVLVILVELVLQPFTKLCTSRKNYCGVSLYPQVFHRRLKHAQLIGRMLIITTNPQSMVLAHLSRILKISKFIETFFQCFFCIKLFTRSTVGYRFYDAH